jgi:hypothetical protein
MIKINKPVGFLLGFLFTLFTYFVSQLFFFIGTEKVKGVIYYSEVSPRRGRYERFYMTFNTTKGETVITKAGTNYDFNSGDSVNIRYKKNDPRRARMTDFSTMWLKNVYYYVILWGLIMAALMGAYAGSKYIIITKKPFSVKTSSY